VRLIMIDRTSDIPRKLWDLSHATCAIIFGPNFPRLSEATIRLWATSGKDRYIVVCHDPKRALFDYERLQQVGSELNVRGYSAALDDADAHAFWRRFFDEELCPLIRDKASHFTGDDLAAAERLLEREEARTKLTSDPTTTELLPGFPHVARKAIAAIDADKSHTAVARIVEPDGPLTATIVRTANLARYGARQRIETLPNALAMIGMQETRQILTGQAMSELVRKVDQSGFLSKEFFAHSVSTGFMAQLLELNVDAPTARQREVLKSLNLPPFVLELLRRFKTWKRFPVHSAFDPFTAGILHDVGKVLNTVCYRDTYPLVLYEIERAKWQSRLLDCERAVVGDLQHPVTSGALLESWEVFPRLVEPIRNHHQIDEQSTPETALVSLANCLVKGMFPFPRVISIPEEYRSVHLYPASDEYPLTNPLPGLFKKHVDWYERAYAELDLSADEEQTGAYRQRSIEALLQLATDAVERSPVAYSEALSAQNPELMDLVEWTDRSAGEWLGFTLLLRHTITEAVNRLLGTTSH
jgi:HD-like signal output (HDOD) protein